MFFFVFTRVVGSVRNEDLAILERQSTTRAGKSTNYSNKCEIQDYHAPKYFLMYAHWKSITEKGFLVVITQA